MTDGQTGSSRATSRRRRALVLLTLVFAPLMLSACGGIGGGGGGGASAGQTTDSSTTFAPSSAMALIKTRGTFIVGTRFDVAPFSSKDPNTGSPSGFDVDLAKSIAMAIFGTSNIEGKINWVPLDPRDYELALEQNKVDVVIGRYPISVARKQFVDFAGPYFDSPQTVLVYNQPSSGGQQYSNLTDLNGAKVCVVTGSTDVASFKSLVPNADTSDVKTTVSQCGADLLAGRVAAIAADHVDELSFLNSAGTNVAALDSTYGTQLYGVGVKKGSNDFRSFLNDQITAFKWGDTYTNDIGTDPNALTQPLVDRY